VKFLDEYRDFGAVEKMAQAIRRRTTRPWNLMEVCGGQTHTIVTTGLQELL
jgi:hydrogenase expression/formation protein HypD